MGQVVLVAPDDAENSLMVIYNKCNTIVSKFVSKKLLDQITDDWIGRREYT